MFFQEFLEKVEARKMFVKIFLKKMEFYNLYLEDGRRVQELSSHVDQKVADLLSEKVGRKNLNQ